MGTNNFLRSVLFIYLGFPLLELALEKGTFWQLIALKKLQSKILILVNRFTAKMFEIVNRTLQAKKYAKHTHITRTWKNIILQAHCICGSVIKCTCALQPNDCRQVVCALKAKNLIFVLISFCSTDGGWFTICSKAKCYNHACTSDATAVLLRYFWSKYHIEIRKWNQKLFHPIVLNTKF